MGRLPKFFCPPRGGISPLCWGHLSTKYSLQCGVRRPLVRPWRARGSKRRQESRVREREVACCRAEARRMNYKDEVENDREASLFFIKVFNYLYYCCWHAKVIRYRMARDGDGFRLRRWISFKSRPRFSRAGPRRDAPTATTVLRTNTRWGPPCDGWEEREVGGASQPASQQKYPVQESGHQQTPRQHRTSHDVKIKIEIHAAGAGAGAGAEIESIDTERKSTLPALRCRLGRTKSGRSSCQGTGRYPGQVSTRTH